MQSSIGNAYVFKTELKDIELATDIPSEIFTEIRQPAHRVLKTLDSGCFFYSGGKCRIYEVRPFDCRVFPFDIKLRDDGNLVWILYHSICPVTFNFREHFPAAKTLLRKLNASKVELELYTKKKSLSSNPRTYIELEPIDIFDIHDENTPYNWTNDC